MSLSLEEFLKQQDDDLKTQTKKDLAKQADLEEFKNRDLKPVEVATMLSVHVNTVKRMLGRGLFAGAYRIGSRGDWRVPRDSVIGFKERGGVR